MPTRRSTHDLACPWCGQQITVPVKWVFAERAPPSRGNVCMPDLILTPDEKWPGEHDCPGGLDAE